MNSRLPAFDDVKSRLEVKCGEFLVRENESPGDAGGEMFVGRLVAQGWTAGGCPDVPAPPLHHPPPRCSARLIDN
ncbi:hypothetical protein J6590_020309 [Homalodisca vitripennis]|nr:hypothetical protein J6590_020309 [Homalodisca vitripennis]